MNYKSLDQVWDQLRGQLRRQLEVQLRVQILDQLRINDTKTLRLMDQLWEDFNT